MKKEQIEDFTDWLIDREECVNEINKEKLALSKENQLRRKIIKLETREQKLIEKLIEYKIKINRCVNESQEYLVYEDFYREIEKILKNEKMKELGWLDE